MAKKGFKVVVKPDQRHRIITEEEMQMFLHTRLKGASVTKNKKGQLQTRREKHKKRHQGENAIRISCTNCRRKAHIGRDFKPKIHSNEDRYPR